MCMYLGVKSTGCSFHQTPVRSVRGWAAVCTRGPCLPMCRLSKRMGNWGSVPVSKRNFSFINTCNNILFGFVPVHSRKDSIFKLSSYFYNTNEREIYSDSEKTGDVKYHSFVTGKRNKGTVIRILVKRFCSWESNKQNRTFMRLPFYCREAGTKFKCVI